MTDIDATLAERGKTHGDYADHARVTQAVKDALRSGPSWAILTNEQRETCEMIAHKLGRVVSGNPHFHDHWHDIIGYTKLVADKLER